VRTGEHVLVSAIVTAAKHKVALGQQQDGAGTAVSPFPGSRRSRRLLRRRARLLSQRLDEEALPMRWKV
jgi:hypothetical protein